ncbi:hypothetical protein DL93DRAFT_2083421 [Clavulina sp. PMI_390]|nr:hypothetical protein DL93DRAFT_2083421 [Clavulina sp. PMI_390]
MKATALPAPVSDYSPAAIAIRRIESTSHPAHGQRGLFASKTIPPNTFVIQYLGEIHVDDRPTSDYDLSLTKFYIPSAISEESLAPGNDPKTPEQTCVNVGVDASAMGNEARFINDYRGTGAERPNAFFKDVRDKQGVLHMTIWTGKEPISKGKEILVSYGKGWWNARLEQEET